MSEMAELKLPGKDPVSLPVVKGTENEHAIDIAKLRGQTGYITLDDGYGNTGSCYSGITFIDGEEGILRYRGYPIEQLANSSTFVETAWMLIWGRLPSASELAQFSALLTQHAPLHEGLRKMFEGIPANGHPMATLSAMINACSTYHPEVLKTELNEREFQIMAAKLLSKVRTIAAFSYKVSIGQPVRYPDAKLDYCSNFLHMMFSVPYSRYVADPDHVKALNMILILHADHEQNCSTSTVRMVGSAKANLFASCAAGVCALWGPLHGGANVAVLDMLDELRLEGIKPRDFMTKVKDKASGHRLMGFGHRVYKNFDPRAKLLKEQADVILNKLGVSDPLLDIARELEAVALSDDYFISRKLYPNVDFYSGIIMRAIGIPINMFTVMFAIGRMPGWIAHWYELRKDPTNRIYRPRQIYTGETQRDYVPMASR
jgi:citrate synthase